MTTIDRGPQRRLEVIPANIREAMELIKGGRCNDDDAFMEVATFAVPILERLDHQLRICDKIRLHGIGDPQLESIVRNVLESILEGAP